MEKYECPYAQQVGSMQADIAAQKVKLASLQAKYDLLTVAQIKEEAEKSGLLKGIKVTAIVIGYTVISVALMAVGHMVGFTELIAKLLKL